MFVLKAVNGSFYVSGLEGRTVRVTNPANIRVFSFGNEQDAQDLAKTVNNGRYFDAEVEVTKI